MEEGGDEIHIWMVMSIIEGYIYIYILKKLKGINTTFERMCANGICLYTNNKRYFSKHILNKKIKGIMYLLKI